MDEETEARGGSAWCAVTFSALSAPAVERPPPAVRRVSLAAVTTYTHALFLKQHLPQSAGLSVMVARGLAVQDREEFFHLIPQTYSPNVSGLISVQANCMPCLF